MMERIRIVLSALGASCILMTSAALAAPTSGLEQIKLDYLSTTQKLSQHVVDEQWIDDDPVAPDLLEHHWNLAASWLVAWLNSHSAADADDVCNAFKVLAGGDAPQCLALDAETFLVANDEPLGNVFLVTRRDGRYQLAWSSADTQPLPDSMADMLSAWHAVNARESQSGAAGVSPAATGPVFPSVGLLPSDANGHSRFYIDGSYAQMAGATIARQITLWVWDGVTVRPLLGRVYPYVIEQAVGTRIDGNLLKVQQKDSFRTFFACGSCEGRQVDWVVRVDAIGFTELGEYTTVPELDLIDELFFRVITGKGATDIASPSVIAAAREIATSARAEQGEDSWKEYPSLGMLNDWTTTNGGSRVCLSTDMVGAMHFKLSRVRGVWFVDALSQSGESCK